MSGNITTNTSTDALRASAATAAAQDLMRLSTSDENQYASVVLRLPDEGDIDVELAPSAPLHTAIREVLGCHPQAELRISCGESVVEAKDTLSGLGLGSDARLNVTSVVERLRPPTKTTDDELAALVQQYSHVREVALAGCGDITDSGVLAVAAQCPELQELDLHGCSNITDAGVQAVAAQCPELQELDLSDCSNITDAGVQAVAAQCPQLQKLNLSLCRNITDAGVQAVAAQCPQLQTLNLSDCSGLNLQWGWPYIEEVD